MIDYKKFGQIITSYVEDYNNTLNKKLLIDDDFFGDTIRLIDFLNNICAFNFPTHENCSFDCESNIDIDEKSVTIKYKIADDEKIITINMKEE